MEPFTNFSRIASTNRRWSGRRGARRKASAMSLLNRPAPKQKRNTFGPSRGPPGGGGHDPGKFNIWSAPAPPCATLACGCLPASLHAHSLQHVRQVWQEDWARGKGAQDVGDALPAQAPHGLHARRPDRCDLCLLCAGALRQGRRVPVPPPHSTCVDAAPHASPLRSRVRACRGRLQGCTAMATCLMQVSSMRSSLLCTSRALGVCVFGCI